MTKTTIITFIFLKSVAGQVISRTFLVANTGFEGALPQMFLECPLDFYA